MPTNHTNSAVDSEALVKDIREKVREVAARLKADTSVEFVEEEYRELYPEVIAAIERGEFKDGYDHWLRYGKAEGRQGRKSTGRNFVAAWTRSYQPGRSFSDSDGLEDSTPGDESADLSRIDLSRSSYQVSRSMLGQAPPGPPSLRGKIGAAFIGGMSKMLWWYTHSIRSAFDAIAQKTDAQTALLRTILKRQGVLAGQIAELESSFSGDLQNSLADARKSIDELRQDGLNSMAALEKRVAKIATTPEITAFDTKLSELAVFGHRTREELQQQTRRISILLEELRRYSPAAGDLPPAVKEDIEATRDDQYLAFENIFRGPQQDIKKIQTEYVPYLLEHGLGKAGRPVVDIGCGRGEWLEVLRDNGLNALGVDSNTKMLATCRQKGLTVTHSDALAFLQSAAESSCDAVTAFHVVEHLPFPKLLAFIEAALRALRPGGCLIMETPNPENVLVGSYTFYTDPTHIRPLPSGLLRFLVEWRGFIDVELRNLHPYPEAMRFPASGGIMAERLNQLLYGPQDYAVLARKP